jgi:hypothetical protein
MGLDGYLVGHSTRGHEKPGSLAQQGCHLILEKVDGGVLTQNIVTYLGCGYGLSHGLARLGYRVTAEINHLSSSLFFSAPFSSIGARPSQSTEKPMSLVRCFYPFLAVLFMSKFTHFLPGKKWVNFFSQLFLDMEGNFNFYGLSR